MNKPTYKKILEHPDKDEIISKLVLGLTTSDIHDWLKSKYSTVSENKFVLSDKTLNSFKSTYLDFYNEMQNDLAKTKSALTTGGASTSDDLSLIVKGNPVYQDALLNAANTELDIDRIMARMAINVENRVSQIYDTIQENPRDINTKIDRVFIEYIEALGNLLDKYYKWKEAPANQIMQHNVTIQVVDQHISVFHDVIKKVLSQMDLETFMYFMEVFDEEFSKLKLPAPEASPSQEVKLAEAKLLNETINQKINATP